MSTLTSIPVSDPKRFLTLQDSYRQELMGDLRLEEASALAARRQMLLENGQVDPNWALPQVKAMSRKLHRLTKRIRQPFGSTPSSSEMFPQDTDDPAEDFAAGPVQALVKRLIQPTPSPIKTPPNKAPVKRKADQLTPQVTPSTRQAKPSSLSEETRPAPRPVPRNPLCTVRNWEHPFPTTPPPLLRVLRPHPKAKLIPGSNPKPRPQAKRLLNPPLNPLAEGSSTG